MKISSFFCKTNRSYKSYAYHRIRHSKWRRNQSTWNQAYIQSDSKRTNYGKQDMNMNGKSIYHRESLSVSNSFFLNRKENKRKRSVFFQICAFFFIRFFFFYKQTNSNTDSDSRSIQHNRCSSLKTTDFSNKKKKEQM